MAGELPAAGGAPFIFATAARLDKISPACLLTWRRVIEKVPGSRLMVMGIPSDAPGVSDRVLNLFRAGGFADEQIILSLRKPFSEYLAEHAKVDLMLDTFPFTGHTVSCHAMWMGVPVVTLAGQTFVSRLGSMLLKNLKLPELIANSEENFVQIAVGLANDLPRLGELRKTLRDRMCDSPLMDANGFAREFESCLEAAGRRA